MFSQYACRWSFNIILTKYNNLDVSNLLPQYEALPTGCFREEVENVKIWFFNHNFMTNVVRATNT